MGIYRQEFTNKKKDGFIHRSRVLLASKNIMLSDKTLEVLYYVMYYIYDDKSEFRNMNQMHIAIAKDIGVYSSYVGAYINDRLIKNGIIERVMSLPADKFSKSRIERYDIPKWLVALYSNKKFKIDITYNYE